MSVGGAGMGGPGSGAGTQLSTLSSTVVSNKESLQKIESELDSVPHTVSKLDYQLNKEKEIYVN
eukprot:13067887-Ditylum_brightwellii.AAC.1